MYNIYNFINRTKHIQPSAGMHTSLSVRTDSNRLFDTTSQTDCQNWLASGPSEHVMQALLRSSYTDGSPARAKAQSPRIQRHQILTSTSLKCAHQCLHLSTEVLSALQHRAIWQHITPEQRDIDNHVSLFFVPVCETHNMCDPSWHLRDSLRCKDSSANTNVLTYLQA